jgi:hypothetical protein
VEVQMAEKTYIEFDYGNRTIYVPTNDSGVQHVLVRGNGKVEIITTTLTEKVIPDLIRLAKSTPSDKEIEEQ